MRRSCSRILGRLGEVACSVHFSRSRRSLNFELELIVELGDGLMLVIGNKRILNEGDGLMLDKGDGLMLVMDDGLMLDEGDELMVVIGDGLMLVEGEAGLLNTIAEVL